MKEKSLSTEQALVISIVIQFCTLSFSSMILDGGQRAGYTQFSFLCYWTTVTFLFIYNYKKKYNIAHRIYIANAFVLIFMVCPFLNFYMYEYGKKYVAVTSIICLSVALFLFIAKQIKNELKSQKSNSEVEVK
ncbi:hypothetical protein [Candidatus Uabimicrobium sp. HlEnr_7]|uniref:hypothetical protein n=1 Tax=Candidatus Uabimicrobium helgolandensis TaxID=3095367 RepID=UPI00355687FF